MILSFRRSATIGESGYLCRPNTFTGKLTEGTMEAGFERAKEHAGST